LGWCANRRFNLDAGGLLADILSLNIPPVGCLWLEAQDRGIWHNIYRTGRWVPLISDQRLHKYRAALLLPAACALIICIYVNQQDICNNALNKKIKI
jgi:hypothetical protein